MDRIIAKALAALAPQPLADLLAFQKPPAGGRPPIDRHLIAAIRRLSVENPLWGAPRIHAELLKLGWKVAQSTVSK